MSNVYDDMAELLQQDIERLCSKHQDRTHTEDEELYHAGIVAGLMEAKRLIKAAKNAVVQIPHLGEVS